MNSVDLPNSSESVTAHVFLHPSKTRTAHGNKPGAGHTDEWWTERVGRSSIRSLTLQVGLPLSTLLNTVTETLYMLIFPQIIT